MSRKHVFPLVVLGAAAAVAALLAVTRSTALGEPASASTGGNGSIAFRLRELDRLEASLQKQLAATSAQQTEAPPVIYEQAPSSGTAALDDEHGDDEGDHGESEDVEHVYGVDRDD